ncbi:group I intron-associated PD-(D/E)XK endonuclease [Aquabacterium sp.]|uniref:group I intron-associated PD-(D/E)XK endonuclease n=1 Tax=Aquabacterium sp. TaxID=1872578 RepID=UPI003B71AA26
MIRQLSFLDLPEPEEESFDDHGIASRHHVLRVSAEMEVGRAGEYLVMADLLLNGWVAYPTSQGVPYDIAVDIGNRVLRVQVKSTKMPKTPASLNRGTPLYVFHTRRAGKGGRRRYSAEDFDVLALVALDRRLIAYYALADCRNDCIAIRVPGLRYGDGGVKCRYFEDAKFEFALNSVLRGNQQEDLSLPRQFNTVNPSA